MPISGLGEFNRALGRFADRVVEEPNRVKRKIALNALRAVTFGTPVDTGRARGNWAIGLESPEREATETTDRSGGPTISKGSSAIARARPGGTIYLNNNVPYIIPLNEGHSKRADPRFIERGVQAAIESVKR